FPKRMLCPCAFQPRAGPQRQAESGRSPMAGARTPFGGGVARDYSFLIHLLTLSLLRGLTFSKITFRTEKRKNMSALKPHPTTGFYAVTRDGKKIYMTTYGPGSTAPITVITNWTDILKK